MANRPLETELERIGARLKELRAENGYTSYRHLADTLDVEPKGVWLMEEGKSDFRYSSLKRILDLYGITVEDFYKSLK